MSKLLVVFIAACGFSPGQSVQPDGGDAGSIANPATCRVSDPALALCLDFEDASLATTARDLAHANDGHTRDVLPMTGHDAEQAARLLPDSNIHIGDVPQLRLSGAFAIEMFLAPASTTGPDSLPYQSSTGYGLEVLGGEVYCGLNGAFTHQPDPSGNLVADRFQHVACSFDGIELRTFVEGKQISCVNVPTANPLDTHLGTDIGSGFMGGIDDIHVYSRALSNAEIATLAGVTATPAQPADCL